MFRKITGIHTHTHTHTHSHTLCLGKSLVQTHSLEMIKNVYMKVICNHKWHINGNVLVTWGILRCLLFCFRCLCLIGRVRFTGWSCLQMNRLYMMLCLLNPGISSHWTSTCLCFQYLPLLDVLFLPRSTLQNYLKRHEEGNTKKGDSSNPFEKGKQSLSL